jgi:hypothetical protein
MRFDTLSCRFKLDLNCAWCVGSAFGKLVAIENFVRTAMPISNTGWELLVARLSVQKTGNKLRTYGKYQVYQNGNPVPELNGNICESVGPGEDSVPNTGLRVSPGRYRLSTHFSSTYRSMGYSEDEVQSSVIPMPAIGLMDTGNRTGILIHPGHLPDLYLSSVGCLNPTGPLSSDQLMDFWDSRARVVSLINDLKNFDISAFDESTDTVITNAHVIIENEPTLLDEDFVV